MDSCLIEYGLNEQIKQEAALYGGLSIARVTEQHRDLYTVISGQGELRGKVSGKFAHNASQLTDFPVVGDWVMVDRECGSRGDAIVHHILRRKSILTRQGAGAGINEQPIAANIDTIFICMSLNEDFNLRRLERYLAIAWDSTATPVVILTKSDLCQDLKEKINQAAAVSIGVDIIACSSENEYGFEKINNYIGQGKSVAFVGSSGVGKSTLINRLLGRDVLAVNKIREDDGKGRHTTTHRQLLLLPKGGVVIDTPGMRELQIYTGNISKTFEDIEELAVGCKYNDCSHTMEPGCKIREAIASGALDEKRFESYLKLRRETVYEGLNFRQVEDEKINRMFGSKKEMKRLLKEIKDKNRR